MAKPLSALLPELPDHGALLRPSPECVWLGSGPWRRSASPAKAGLSFFAPDFQLQHPEPWLLPATGVETTTEEVLSAIAITAAASEPPLRWQAPSAEHFAESFAEIQRRIEGDGLRKAVPVFFEHARAAMAPDRLRSLLGKLLAAPATLTPYGWWDGATGELGATPELLAASDGTVIRTMALAGTRRRPEIDEPWDDPKEIREHEIVVEDVCDALAPLGKVTKAPRRLLRLATMDHFLTEITLAPFETPDLALLARALHPTPALGVAPRSYGFRWLREIDGEDRGGFGAPFGASWSDGRFVCVVAIRNLQWTGDRWRIGAGCGILPESHLESEWRELELKRRSVKGLLSL